MKKKITGKDLTKEAPRSPRVRIAGYAILGRTIDKCRALVAGNIGEYHFDCPLDNTVFGFKGVKGDDFKAQIEQGASDQEMVEWLNQNGEKKTPEEIERWAEEVEASSLYNHPEKRDFFKRSRNSDSIRPKRQRSSGSKSTIEFLTRSKPRREQSKVDRLLLKTMGSHTRRSRKTRIRRQSRTYFANALRTTRSTLELCLDQRRGNVFGYSRVQSAAQLAVTHTVEKINCQSDCEPHNEPDPGHHRQTQH